MAISALCQKFYLNIYMGVYHQKQLKFAYGIVHVQTISYIFIVTIIITIIILDLPRPRWSRLAPGRRQTASAARAAPCSAALPHTRICGECEKSKAVFISVSRSTQRNANKHTKRRTTGFYKHFHTLQVQRQARVLPRRTWRG